MKTIEDFRGKREQVKPLKESVQVNQNTTTIPSTLLLQKKYVRQLPNDLSVIVYWSAQLKRYISIPFSDVKNESINEAKDPKPVEDDTDNLSVLQHIIVTNNEDDLSFSDGSTVHVDPDIANLMIACFGRLTPENQKKFEEALNKSALTFQKAFKFCKKHQT
jgi:hypothetical protein